MKIVAPVKAPKLQKRFGELGARLAERASWGEVIRSAGIKLQQRLQ